MKRRLLLILVLVTALVMVLGACQQKEEEPKIFKVSFDFGYNTMVSSQLVTSGEVATPPAIPDREGYAFVKWQSGGQDFDLTQPITSDTMLRAVWLRLKPITLVVEGKRQPRYIVPKDSYTLEDFAIEVSGRTVAGLYSIVNGKPVHADIANGIADDAVLYVDTMTAGLTFEKVAGKDEYALVRVDDDVREVAIPVFYEGLPVTTIGANALHTDKTEEVGGVMKHIRRLDSISLGAVLVIGEGALSQVYADEILIPKTVTTIRAHAFATSGFNKVTFEEDSHIELIEANAFMAMDTLESIKLPYGLPKLYGDTFISCINLKRVYIPNTVVDIENYVFRGCVSIEVIYRQKTDGSIRIGKSWNDLGNGQFASYKEVASDSALGW